MYMNFFNERKEGVQQRYNYTEPLFRFKFPKNNFSILYEISKKSICIVYMMCRAQ